MKPQNAWKILLIIALSSCAGSPPKMERPVKFYYGDSSRGEMCRSQRARITAWVKTIARHGDTRKYAERILRSALAQDSNECISAFDPKFGQFIGIPVDDVRVMLQYNEDLLYSCEKWRQ